MVEKREENCFSQMSGGKRTGAEEQQHVRGMVGTDGERTDEGMEEVNKQKAWSDGWEDERGGGLQETSGAKSQMNQERREGEERDRRRKKRRR